MAAHSFTAQRDPGPPPGTPTEETREFLEQALQRFHMAAEAESEIRRDALSDFQFTVGEQWDADNFNSRTRDSRPCLTMNRLRAFRRIVTNEQRQQRPSIQINPVGDEGDVATAEVIQGLCRHIEQQSDAEIAYDTGFEHMVTGGFGYWRIITDYVDDDSNEQEIYLKRVRNPFSVYFDPRAIEPDYSDALWCFVVDDMPREVYREQYPDSAVVGFETLQAAGDPHTLEWISRDSVRLAEYFYVELERSKRRERDSVKRTVKWAKINALEVLEEREVASKWIPVVPVLGDDTVIDGRRNLVGLIRDMKDPQRVYNYHISATAEAVALAPKAPWVVAEGQLETHEGEWEMSNRRNLAVLTYKPVSSATGQPVSPPQRNSAEPPIQALSAMIRQADNDLKAVSGIYDASLGQQGPEQSGKAVLLRQKQSDIANLNFTDNLARSIRHTGRILLDMIPRIYTTAQVRRIVNPDGTTRMVGVFNSQNGDQASDIEGALPNGKAFDIGLGRYDVTVSVGPSYQSKRQEAVASQVALISSYPQIMQVAGDLLVRNMDWPGASEIADRLKRLLPPALQQMEGDPQQQAQQMQAQNQQLQQQNQAMAQAMQHMNQVISQKLIETQGKENAQLIDAMTKINVARITASKDRDIAGADRELTMLGMAHDSAHEAASQAVDQQHESMMQGQDQMHEAAMSQMPQPQPAQPAGGGAPGPGGPGGPAGPGPQAPPPSSP